MEIILEINLLLVLDFPEMKEGFLGAKAVGRCGRLGAVWGGTGGRNWRARLSSRTRQRTGERGGRRRQRVIDQWGLPISGTKIEEERDC